MELPVQDPPILRRELVEEASFNERVISASFDASDLPATACTSCHEDSTKPTSSQDEPALVSRLMGRISELEQKLYLQDASNSQALEPPIRRESVTLNAGSSFSSPRSLFKWGSKLDDSPTPQAAPRQETLKSARSEWFSSFTASLRRKSSQPEMERPASEPPHYRQWPSHRVSQLDRSITDDGASDSGYDSSTFTSHTASPRPFNGTYYRYIFDPADVEAELEVTHTVRKAAAEALADAHARLKAADDAQRELRQQLQEASIIAAEVDRLKGENAELLARRSVLEDETRAAKAALCSMQHQTDAAQEELDSMRRQADIWRSTSTTEMEKVKQENQLLRSHLQTRLAELASTKQKVVALEGEVGAARQAGREAEQKLQGLAVVQARAESAAADAESARRQLADWQEKFMKERAVRRRLHEQLQVLRGNIRVMARVRPPVPGTRPILGYPLDGMLALSPGDGRRYQEFEFDAVFSPEVSQADVFAEVSPLVRSAADGYNVCILAYGQTGSGKTFTMEGPAEQPGINTRALQELFTIAAEEGGNGSSWHTSVAMMEVYNDTVHDLLRSPSEVGQPLEVSGLGPAELPAGAERVPGLVWRQVGDIEAVKAVLREGGRNRATASTAMNSSSSRSHAILCVRLAITSAEGKSSSSSIYLVDLAGSERVDKSEVVGAQLKEAQAINKSLAALGDVISSLQRRSAHIPFRNSKLTQVLQDALCGSSKVLLVCNLSPEAQSASETLSSLNFASRAAQVELGQARRTGDRDEASSCCSKAAGTPKAAAAAAAAGVGPFAEGKVAAVVGAVRVPMPGQLSAAAAAGGVGGKQSKPAGLRSSVRDSVPAVR